METGRRGARQLRRRIRRALRATHRWLGSFLCVIFALWFASGIVMSFEGYPDWGPDDRLQFAPQLRLPIITPSMAAIFATSTVAITAEARLNMLGQSAVWRFEDKHGRGQIVHADTGAKVTLNDDELVGKALASANVLNAGSIISNQRLHQPDQWTLYPSVRAALPLRHVRLNDPAETDVYVSLPRAEVVQRTTARSRTFAWCGAIPHWLYLRVLATSRGYWRQIVISLAAGGAVACAAGLALGLWNWRPRTLYRVGTAKASSIPYRKTWLRLHHLLGLSFGSVAFSYVFSGMLSLQPFNWSGNSTVPIELGLRLSGGVLEPSRFTLPIDAALKACEQQLVVKEMTLAQIGSVPFYVCKQRIGQTRVVVADQPAAKVLPHIPVTDVTRTLGSSSGVVPQAEFLEAYDNYYRPNHFYPALALPVIRLRWPDAESTWDYVDLSTARFVKRVTKTSRLERWLYNGMHSLDFAWLYGTPWLWHTVVFAFCLGGFSLSVSGLVLAVGWIRRKARTNRVRPP